jgi:hypothetical protein
MQPNYPPQQYAPPMPQYPTAPAPQYPPQPTYPMAPAPQYPQQPPAYPQGYAQPQYAPNPYAAPAPPAPPLPTGSLDSYYSQPSGGGGPSFKFMDANRQPQIGKSYAGFVARPVTDADIRAQTDQSGRVQTFKDGRPKFVMVVPMQVQPSQEFPDGVAGWWVKGQARDELARAMAEAGAPAGAPEAGAFIRVTLTGVRPVPNMSPAYQYRVEYVRPQGAAPAQMPGGPVEQYNNPAAPVSAGEVAPQPQYAAPSTYAPGYPPTAGPEQIPTYAAAPAHYAQPPAQPMPPQAPPQPAPAPQPQYTPQSVSVPATTAGAPAGFSPDQAALFAKLTGQQAAA